ncbi:MAG: SDR family oxidoreductase [Acetobacteraceae bacterium]|nr:SDR family oxidoreductase [Acetobacteraceae bacterium]
MFSLQGKVALVTGSSRGLGWAIAEALSSAGAHVVLNGRDPATLGARAAELSGSAGGCTAVAFDVTDAEAVAAGVAEIGRRCGRLDVAVCNAGIVIRKATLETSDAEWDAVLETDLSACFRVAREAARAMVRNGWGRIIMISSVMGTIARPTIASYVASKAGLHGLTRALAVELGPMGINVNCIGPGFYPTEANQVIRDNKEFYDWVSSRSPLNRWGDPQELGGAAIYFASDASSFCNGQVLTIDGGMTVAL